MHWLEILTSVFGGSLFTGLLGILYIRPRLKTERAGADKATTDASESKFDLLIKRINAMEQLYNKQGEIMDKMRSHQLELESEIQTLKEHGAKMETENSQLRAALKRVEEENGALKSKMSQLTDENENLKIQMGTLTDELNSYRAKGRKK